MDDLIKLNVHEILEKEFSIDFKGYSAPEVDQFLDKVIADYNNFEKVIKKYNSEIEALEQKLAKSEMKIIELEESSRKRSSGNESETNVNYVDLVKRIARLEAMVYNK